MHLDPLKQAPSIYPDFTLKSVESGKIGEQGISADELKFIKETKTQISQAKSDIQMSDWQLAQVLGDACIKGTKHDRGSLNNSLYFWGKVLNHESEGTGLIPIGLNKGDPEIFFAEINKIYAAQQLIQSSNPESLQNYVKESLVQDRYCAIPVSYQGTNGNPEHTFICLFYQTDQGLYCQLMDKGEGSAMHPVLSAEGTIKRSYLFYPIQISDSQFFDQSNPVCKDFLTRIMHYANHPPVAGGTYSSAELYRLMMNLGQPITDVPLPPEEESVSPTRSGTSAEQIPRLYMRYLIGLMHPDLRAEEKIRLHKRLMFAGKLQALVSGYQTPDINPQLLKRLAEDFQLSSKKLLEQGLITRKEFLQSVAAVELALEKGQGVPSDRQTLTLPAFDREVSVQHAITPVDLNISPMPSLPTRPPPELWKIRTPEPAKMKDYLQEVRDKMNHFPDKSSNALLYSLMQTVSQIPVPSYTNDAFWEKVPAVDRLECLKILNEIGEQVKSTLVQTTPSGAAHHQLLLFQLSLLSIADKISRLQYPEMAPFRFPFPLETFGTNFILQRGDDTVRYQQLQSYFISVARHCPVEIFKFKQQEYSEVFNIKFLNVEEADFDSMDRLDTGVHKTLSFARQFLEIAKARGMKVEKGREKECMMLLLADFTSKKTGDDAQSVLDTNFLPEEIKILKKVSGELKYLGYIVDNPGAFAKDEQKCLELALNPDKHINYDASIIESKSAYPKFSVTLSETGLKAIPNVAKEALVIEGPTYPFAHYSERILTDDLIRAVDNFSERAQENEVMVQTPTSEGKIQDPRVFHDLKKIQAAGELKIPLLIQWCRENRSLFERQEMRVVLEHLLFKDSSLFLALSKEPLLLESIRSMVDEHLAGIVNPERFRENLFWIMLGNHIETTAEQIPGSPGTRERLSQLQTRLDHLAEKVLPIAREKAWVDAYKGAGYDLAAFQCYLAGSQKPLLDQDIVRFAGNFLRFSQLDPGDHQSPDWIAKGVLSTWNLNRVLIMERIGSSPEILRTSLQPLLDLYGISPQAVPFPQSKLPIVSFKIGEDSFDIDLMEGTFKKNGRDLCLVRPPDSLDLVIHRFAPKSSSFCKVSEGVYETLDGKFRFQMPVPPNREVTIIQSILYGGKTLPFKFFPRLDKAADALPKPAWENKRCWIAQDPDNREHQIILIRNPNDTPFLEGKITPEGTILNRPSAKDRMGEQLVAIDTKSDIGSFLSTFVDLRKLLVWGKKTGSGIQITGFEIPVANHLSFTVRKTPEGKISVSCDLYPDYEFSQQQSSFETGYLQGAINLQHKSDPAKQKILMPLNAILSSLHDENIKVLSYSKMTGFVGDEDLTFVAYDVDPKLNRLRSDSELAMVYLIYALMQQGRCHEAAEYLEHLPKDLKVDPDVKSILCKCFEPSKLTPESVGLAVKIAHQLCEWNKDHTSRGDQSFVHLIPALESYVRFRKAGQLQHLPPDMRLNDQELYKLMQTVKKSTDPMISGRGQAKKWQHSLTLPLELERLKLSRGESAGMVNSLEGVGHTSDLLDRLHWDTDEFTSQNLQSELEGCRPSNDPECRLPVRFSFYDIIHNNFKDLFAQALAAEGRTLSGFDFNLAALYENAMNQRSVYDEAMSKADIGMLITLSYVRRFPDHFRHIDLNTRDWAQAVAEASVNIRSQLGEAVAPAASDIPSSVRPQPQPMSAPSVPIPKSKIPHDLVHLPGIDWSHPLGDLGQRYLDRSQEKILKPQEQKFLLDQTRLATETEMTKRLGAVLQASFDEKVKNKSIAIYKPKKGLEELEKDLTSQQNMLSDDLKTLRAEIDALLQPPTDEEISRMPTPEARAAAINYRTEYYSKQKIPLTFERDVLFNVISHNVGILRKHNPYLNEQKLNALNQKTLAYLIKSSFLDQTKAAKSLAGEAMQDPSKVQALGELMDRFRNYNPAMHPELLLYEYATGLMLRNNPDQAALLIKIFNLVFSENLGQDQKAELRRLMFEFQAGGGKTKVISAIIAAKAGIEGKNAVFFSLPELFDITKNDLRDALDQAFRMRLNVINITLQTDLNAAMLEELCQKLEGSAKTGMTHMMTPEGFHALNLAYQSALGRSERGKVKWLSRIDQFFRTQGIGLIDESHRNADALLQANKALGTPESLSGQEQDLLLDIFDLMAGEKQKTLRLRNDMQGRLMHEVLGLKKNLQASLSPEELHNVLETLADEILKLPQLELGTRKPAELNELKSYLLDPKAQPPRWLLEANGKNATQAKLIGLARGMLTEIFPHTLRLVGEMDYGPSINPGDALDAPRRQKNPTTAKFEIADIAAVLSIQGRLQRGITSPADFESFLRYLKARAKQEKTPKMEFNDTPTAQMFLTWQGDARPKIALEEIEINNYYIQQITPKLAATVGKNPEAVRLFLKHFVLPQVKIYSDKQTSTAQDLMSAFHSTVMFSATLGNVEQYHTLGGIEERFWEDAAFQAEVIQRASLPQNSTLAWLQPGTPGQLFEDLHQKDPKLFDKLDGALDMGGWSKDVPPLEYARQFNEFAKAKNLPFDGITFFQREEIGGRPVGEKALYFLPMGETRPVKLNSTNIPQELARLGLEKPRVFKLYAPEDTTGTDLVLAKDAKMLMTLGEGATLSLAIQTIMRMRQFLANPIDPASSQSFLTVAPHKLQEKIRASISKAPDAPLTLADCFAWLLAQEADRREKATIQRAYQEIQFVFRDTIMQEIRKHVDNPTEQIIIFHSHRGAFYFHQGRDPFDLYGWGMEKGSTAEALRRFAENFAAQAGIDLNEHTELNSKIAAICEKTAKVVKEVEQKARQDFTSQAQAEQETRQEQVQEQRQEARQEQQALTLPAIEHLEPLEASPYASEQLALNRPVLAMPDSPFHVTAAEVFRSRIFSPDLSIAQNVLATNKTNPDVPSYLKPVEYVLIIEDTNEKLEATRRAIAVSQEDAKAYQAQLLKGEGCPGIHKRKAALFTRDGNIVATGRGALSFSSPAELAKLRQTEWFSSIKTQVGLLSGKVTDEERINAMIKTHGQEFTSLWKEIFSKSLDPHSLDFTYVQSLLAAQGIKLN